MNFREMLDALANITAAVFFVVFWAVVLIGVAAPLAIILVGALWYGAFQLLKLMGWAS